MKIIVDPSFPEPQPFVDIIQQVAKRFEDRMLHKAILAGKLAMLEVSLKLRIPTEEEHSAYRQRKKEYEAIRDILPAVIWEKVMNETVYDMLHIEGSCRADFSEGCVADKMELYAFPGACLREFADTVAHELTHMLVSGSLNYSFAATPTECGTVPYGSSIRRRNPETGTDHGLYMEEIIAHTVAEWIVRDMPLPADQSNEDRYCPVQNWIDLCNRMADGFGVPLNELRYLDEFRVTDQMVEIPNFFWYAVAVNQFGGVICAFDEIMGQNAYETLCGYLDARNEEAEEQAEGLLREFSRRCEEEN